MEFSAPATISGQMSKYNLKTYPDYLRLLNKLWKKKSFLHDKQTFN